MTNIRFPSLVVVSDLLSQNATIAAYKKRFADWSTRNDLYADNTGYEKYNEWLYSSKLNQQVEKLTEALIALEELQRRKGSISNADEMEVVIKRIIHTELTKLEIVQLRKLQKIQGFERKDLKLANDNVTAAIKSLNSSIKAIEAKLADEFPSDIFDDVVRIDFNKLTKPIEDIKKHIAKSNRPEILNEQFAKLDEAIEKLRALEKRQKTEKLELDDHHNRLNEALSIIKETSKSIEDLIDVKLKAPANDKSEDLDERSSDVETLTKELKLKHKETKKAINGRKVSYSSQIKAIKDSEGQSVLSLIKFFERHEKKFRFTSQLDKAGHVSTVLDIPKQSVNLVERIAEQLPTVLTISKEIGGIFAAIPIINLIIKGFTDVVSLMKHLIQRKSSNKLLEASITGIVTSGAMILSVLVPVTALLITGAFAIYGFVRGNIIPFIKKFREFRKAKNEVRALQETMGEREHDKRSLSVITLAPIEKQMLLRLIEKDLLENSYDRNNKTMVASLREAKALINSKKAVSIDELASNTVLQKALNLDTSLTEQSKKSVNFIDRLHSADDDVIEQQEKKIKKLKASLFSMVFGSGILGAASFGAAVLLSIPTPPTIIAGAAIMLATAVIGVALKYGLPSMVMNFFKDKFGSDKKEEKKIDKSAEPGEEPRISAELAVSSTNVAVRALNDKAIANGHDNKPVKAAETENKTEEWRGALRLRPIGTSKFGGKLFMKFWDKRQKADPVAVQEAQENSSKLNGKH